MKPRRYWNVGGNRVGLPAVVTGPTWTDNGDLTGEWTGTTDIDTYAGFDYGTAPATYAFSAFDYDGAGPALALDTDHVIPIPDALAGGTIAAGTYYGRWWAGTPEGFTGYISDEQTFV